MNLVLEGIFGLPVELKEKNEFEIQYEYDLYILGQKISGGKFE